MDMKRFFLYAIAIAALALAGCGGNGGGTPMVGTMMPPTTPTTCGDGEELNADTNMCQAITPPGPAVDHMAITGGIVSPGTAGDPSTARDTDEATRPGQADGTEDDFAVTPGMVGTAGITSIGDDNLDVVEMTDDEPIPGQFMPVADSETMLGDFTGSMYDRTLMEGKQTDTITVYTNEGDPGDQAYTEYYAVQGRDGVAGTADETTGAVTLTGTGDADLFYGSGFPTMPNSFTTLPNEDVTMTEDVTENAFAGMFNGVPGMYSCGGDSACRAENDADGELSLIGMWTFTPTKVEMGDDAHMVSGVVYDSDYLSFGYWVQMTEDEDGEVAYGVGTFYDGATGYNPGGLATLTGSASYSGNAAGMYARKTFNSDGSVASLTTGHYTADASLMAVFGQTTEEDIAPNMLNTLSGYVSNFRDGGEMVDDSWKVELNEIDLNEDNNFPNFSGTTTGQGNWRGSFYGPNQDTDNEPIMPSGVAGDFTGHFGDGHVIGAFGAEKD